MSQAFGAVNSAAAANIGAFDGSVGRAIGREGLAARRIAAPPSVEANGKTVAILANYF
jgi:hypothetical protein